ncbi:MAG: DUF3047 domain-containing protein [Gammaproteobacteria bacterium]|nr:DUF3047 domain-containing protein [Gammaproteobacteria bacterium]
MTRLILIFYFLLFSNASFSNNNSVEQETSIAIRSPLIIGDFSAHYDTNTLPIHWEELYFDGIDKHTDYQTIIENNHGIIQASSHASSSGLVRKVQIDPAQYSNITWRWKIQDIIDTANLSSKKGDDAPARVYITFAYDADKVSWWEVVQFEVIKLFYGEYPPIRAITYVWSSHLPKDTVIDSPYTKRVKVFALQSGRQQKGIWLTEQRNITQDYHTAFGDEPVPIISGIAVMTDTDNTRGEATAWYGDIQIFQ